jgi:hypothetical protein
VLRCAKAAQHRSQRRCRSANRQRKTVAISTQPTTANQPRLRWPAPSQPPTSPKHLAPCSRSNSAARRSNSTTRLEHSRNAVLNPSAVLNPISQTVESSRSVLFQELNSVGLNQCNSTPLPHSSSARSKLISRLRSNAHSPRSNRGHNPQLVLLLNRVRNLNSKRVQQNSHDPRQLRSRVQLLRLVQLRLRPHVPHQHRVLLPQPIPHPQADTTSIHANA